MEQNYYSLREFNVDELDIKLDSDINFTGEIFFARLKLNDDLLQCDACYDLSALASSAATSSRWLLMSSVTVSSAAINCSHEATRSWVR